MDHDRSGSPGEFELFRKLVEGIRQDFERRRRRDKKKSFLLQMATVVLSAGITVLLGLRVDGLNVWFSNIALVFGALVTVCAAWDAFFEHRQLWIIRASTVFRLESLERRLRTLGPNNGGLGGLADELEQILADDHREWQTLRANTRLEVDRPERHRMVSGRQGDELGRQPMAQTGADDQPPDTVRRAR